MVTFARSPLRDMAALLVALLALTLGACSSDGEFDPNDPRLANARLEFVSNQTQTLRFRAGSDLIVRYVDSAGQPIEGAPLRFEFAGEEGDTQLAALTVDTDAGGQANNRLTAGTTNVSFRVTVTPPRGDAIEFIISVSDADAGSIRVVMTYAGTREITAFKPYLFQNVLCSALSAMNLPTAVRQGAAVARVTAGTGFSGVPVGNMWTVGIVAERTAGAPVAFGCADRIAVQAARETPVNIMIRDIEATTRFEGVYELDNRLDFTGILPDSVADGVHILDELTDDNNVNGNPATEDYGQDPGAFLVDLAMRQSCAWECLQGESYETCSTMDRNHRLGDISALYRQNFRNWDPTSTMPGAVTAFTTGCGIWEDAAIPAQNLINAQVSSFIPGFVTNIGMIAGDLARAIDQARVKSYLTLNASLDQQKPMTHELISMEVILHDLEGDEHSFTVDLADVGLTSIRFTGTVTVTGNTLNIPAHSFMLDYGRLVRYIFVEGVVKAALGYESTTAMLQDWIDCGAIAESLESSVGILSESQYYDICSTGLMFGGPLLEEAISGYIDADGTLTLQGTAMGADLDSQAVAQRMNMGMWMGTWGEMARTSNISGTFIGLRLP